MKYRKFGKTDMEISEVGFGAWAIGGDAKVGEVAIGWGPADDATSVKALHAALDAGVNFFDTADFYGLGHSEALIGKVLGKNKEALIATKVGHRALHNKIELDYSQAYIMEACEHSLRRLKRDTIDYYQLHSARVNHLQHEDCVAAMELLKKQGKIRYWGLSLNTFDPGPEAELMMENQWGDGLQLVFNLVNQTAYPIMAKASAAGYGIIARMPLQFGLLTGKIKPNATFAAGDHRSFRLSPELISKTLDVLEQKIWPLAEKKQLSKTGIALSFILSFQEVSTVIPGIRTADHIRLNTTGITQLDIGDKQYLQELYHNEWKPVMDLMKKQG